MWQSNRPFAWILLCLTARLAAGAGAQTVAPTTLAQAAERIASRHRIVLFVDPELHAPRGVTPIPPDHTLNRGLDLLAARVPGAAWRRVYLPEHMQTTPTAARLAAIVRTLDAVEPAHLTVDLAERRELIRFVRSPGTPDAAPMTPAGTREYFILYNSKSTSDGRSPEARMAELQRQQLGLESADEHLPIGVGQLIEVMKSLPPDRMERLAGPTVEASFRLWDATPPDQRESMMGRMTEVIQPLLNAASRRPSANAGRPAQRVAPPTNRLPELARIARTLATRHEAEVIVDPTLYVTEKPVPPAAALPLPRALTALSRPLSGVGWRKVEVPESLAPKLSTPRTAVSLAAAVRELQSLEQPSIEVHNIRTGTTTRFVLWDVRSTPQARDSAPALHNDPIYLLYDTSPFATGRTPAERLLSIQQQQFNAMFRMSPDQLSRTMEDALHTYQTADPAAQKRVLSLPILSGMMAGWFPRQAKENMR